MEVGTGKLGSGELDVELRTLELRGWVRWFSGDLHTFSSRMRCALFVFVFLFREIAGERFGIYIMLACLLRDVKAYACAAIKGKFILKLGYYVF